MVNNLYCANYYTNYTALITIPAGTTIGNHRLRFRASLYYAVSDPCSGIFFGNAGDFTLNVISAGPTVTTNTASIISASGATLNGMVNANGNTTTVSFDYGQTSAYGNTVSSVPSTVSGNTMTAVMANLTNLNPGTIYHFRCVGVNIGGTTFGSDQSFTTNTIIPDALIIGTETVSGSSCYNALQTITVAGNGTTFTVQNGGDATLIAGQNILLKPGTMVQPGGDLWGYITTTGAYCVNPSAPVHPTSIEEDVAVASETGTALFRVYPSPTTERFTLELNDEMKDIQANVRIYNMIGEEALQENLAGTRKQEFSLSGKSNGIYIIRVMMGERTGIAKIIKQD
jgi:hypothetical protein